MVERTEGYVHSTEESDDFIKQFHDLFLDSDYVFDEFFCDSYHKNKSTLHLLNDQQK